MSATLSLSDLCRRIESGDRLSTDDFNIILDKVRRTVEPIGEKANADH